MSESSKCFCCLVVRVSSGCAITQERGLLRTCAIRTDASRAGESLIGARQAVSWGKVYPSMLPDTVVCYVDSTIALPIIAQYAISKHAKRKPKRLYKQLPKLLGAIEKEYLKAQKRAKREK